VIPVLLASKWREGIRSITNEAAGGVGVETQQERDEQMVRVPESLERLLSNAVVSGCVHQQHAEKHNVTSHTTSLSVVDLYGSVGSNLRLLDVEKTGEISSNSFSMV
jgi:hypothetical protein